MATVEMKKLVSFFESRGITVDESMRKILEYFREYYQVYFHPSGSGHPAPDLNQKLAEKLGIDCDTVVSITSMLRRAGLLVEEKGLSSVGGKEYWFGIPDWLRNQLVSA
ncbi:MAG: hypothetical protein HYW89_00410 [Candidatus Sungiibacteriota bacterium]|uniref:Uncharacterized protein n=1 Tax=Candidatus Sungiibacteriota bacterium TaxID=2750080 RepID=A0A7T5RJR6_9BACT|nr:MAG: hypothetical protein HYW89_00410 [Candidatus Sungbacteria bacterium]